MSHNTKNDVMTIMGTQIKLCISSGYSDQSQSLIVYYFCINNGMSLKPVGQEPGMATIL